MRHIAFFSSLVILLGTSLLTGLFGSPQNAPIQTIFLYLTLFVFGTTTALFFPRKLNWMQAVSIILLISGLVRVLLAFHPVSDDVNRYLWEGKITRHGINPYAITADMAPANSIFRDYYWTHMNHKDAKTAYPPLAILIFSIIGLFSYAPIAYKFIFVAFDMGIICLILYMLRTRLMPLRLALFYAINPLILYSYACEAHFDSMLVFFILLAVICSQNKWMNATWFFLAFAIQIKVVAIVLIPLFLRNRGWRGIWAAGPILLIPTLFFRNHMYGFFDGVYHFGSHMAHNGTVHHILRVLLGTTEYASYTCAALLSVTIIIIFFRIKDSLTAVACTLASLILFSPTIHFWYIAWILPFVFFIPSMPWFYLTGAMSLYFLTWYQLIHAGFWHLPGYIKLLQWIPFFAILLWQCKYAIRKLFALRKPYQKRWQEVSSVGIIIPTLNEEAHIKACLDSIIRLDPKPQEVVVCDGGSTDNTLKEIDIPLVKIIHTEAGRGNQIAAAIKEMDADTILILHADCQCEHDVLKKIVTYLNNNPYCAGGCLGQIFKEETFTTAIIEILNDFRAIFFHQSFGDQGQFFRKELLEETGGFPNQKLMEDVELSERIEEFSTPGYLGNGIITSGRKWIQKGSLKRLFLILQIITSYRINKLLNKNISEELYKKYYSKN
jgi:rSAM/selenodomain-associated transferase 2